MALLVIPRAKLLELREKTSIAPSTRGRVSDDEAKSDVIGIEVELKGDAATGWHVSLTEYLDRWPDSLAPVTKGPGTVRSAQPEA